MKIPHIPKVQIPKLFPKRPWGCPGCERVFQVPEKDPDPLFCRDCTAKEKERQQQERERQRLALAEARVQAMKQAALLPFRFVGNTIKAILLGVLIVLGIVAMAILVLGNLGAP